MKAPSPCKYCGIAGTHLEFTFGFVICARLGLQKAP